MQCQIFLNRSKTSKVIGMIERCTGNLITIQLCQIKKWVWSFTKLNETNTCCYKIQGFFSKSCVSFFGFHWEYRGSKCELDVGDKRIWGDLGTNSSGQCKLSHFLFEKETHNHLRLQDKSLLQVKRPGEKEIQESLDFTYTLANRGHKWSEIIFNRFSDTCT